METMTINAADITPLHKVMDFDKLESIKTSLRSDGWTGRPVLLIETINGYRGLTGSHRIEAAQQVGVDVPALVITADEADAANLDADYLASTDDDDRAYRIRRAGLTEAADLMDAENS